MNVCVCAPYTSNAHVNAKWNEYVSSSASFFHTFVPFSNTTGPFHAKNHILKTIPTRNPNVTCEWYKKEWNQIFEWGMRIFSQKKIATEHRSWNEWEIRQTLIFIFLNLPWLLMDRMNSILQGHCEWKLKSHIIAFFQFCALFSFRLLKIVHTHTVWEISKGRCTLLVLASFSSFSGS